MTRPGLRNEKPLKSKPSKPKLVSKDFHNHLHHMLGYLWGGYDFKFCFSFGYDFSDYIVNVGSHDRCFVVSLLLARIFQVEVLGFSLHACVMNNRDSFLGYLSIPIIFCLFTLGVSGTHGSWKCRLSGETLGTRFYSPRNVGLTVVPSILPSSP